MVFTFHEPIPEQGKDDAELGRGSAAGNFACPGVMTDYFVQIVLRFQATYFYDLAQAGVWAGDDGVDLDEGDDGKGGSGEGNSGCQDQILGVDGAEGIKGIVNGREAGT